MDEMIQRVARAIEGAIDGGSFATATTFEVAARAAIEAMRKPTEVMEAAWYSGVEKGDPHGLVSPDGYTFNLYGWQAMIDAARCWAPAVRHGDDSGGRRPRHGGEGWRLEKRSDGHRRVCAAG